MSAGEAGGVTGTRDKDYNIIWFVEACLSNALRLEQYIQDAERDGDSELAGFFPRARARAARARNRARSCSSSAWAAEQDRARRGDHVPPGSPMLSGLSTSTCQRSIRSRPGSR